MLKFSPGAANFQGEILAPLPADSSLGDIYARVLQEEFLQGGKADTSHPGSAWRAPLFQEGKQNLRQTPAPRSSGVQQGRDKQREHL